MHLSKVYRTLGSKDFDRIVSAARAMGCNMYKVEQMTKSFVVCAELKHRNGSLSSREISETLRKYLFHGPGLFEFLEDGNTIKYEPRMDLDIFIQALKEIWYDKV